MMFWFLIRLAGNEIGVEGARHLAEPLGKLTALQQLQLYGMAAAVFSWIEDVVACDHVT